MIGTGYVGLVTGACFAEMGHIVMCLDIDQPKIEQLKKGLIPIFEPGLEILIQRNMCKGRLLYSSNYTEAIDFSEVCFITVPTPPHEDGSCDLSYIDASARHIGATLKEYRLIVNKSTVPVGTAERVEKIVREELVKRKKDISFDIAANPEFLKEGAAIRDCLEPDRIIIGTSSQRAETLLRELYRPFGLIETKFLSMDILSAEMTKYAANAMLATRISFMNEMADICTRVGANINEVRKGIGSDLRIGHGFLNPGVGFGGSCFPKDLRALVATAKSVGCKTQLLEAVQHVNHRQKKLLGKIILNYFADRGGLKGKTIAVWGLSFKPETDDMREAPSLSFIEDLLLQGAQLRLFDPVAIPKAQELLKNRPELTWCDNELDAVRGADAVALLTEWSQFTRVDFNPVRESMKGIAFFDGRNQYLPIEMKQKGFDYIAIGIPEQLQDKR